MQIRDDCFIPQQTIVERFRFDSHNHWVGLSTPLMPPQQVVCPLLYQIERSSQSLIRLGTPYFTL